MLLLCVLLLAQSGSTNSTQPLLKGLNKIVLSVSSLPSDWEVSGFTSERLKTDAEIRLRRAGIEITEDLSADPLLIVSLDHFSDGGSIVYMVMIRLSEDAVVPDRGVRTLATTWSRASYGTVGRGRVDSLRGTISDKIDDFINDWLKANPPARSGSFQEFLGRDRPRVIVPPGALGSQPVTKKY